ncbi:MAG TPA: sulfatase-like hydrolase/transferase [Polyangiales bacterium]
MPSYPMASVLALLLSCAIELLFVPAPIDPLGMTLLVCLCVPMGMLHGLGWQLLFSALRRLPRWSQIIFWCGVGVGAGAWLSFMLGAFYRLNGPYRALALQVLGGSALVAAGLSLISNALQPTQDQPAGVIFGQPAWLRRLLVPLLLAAAVGCLYADSHYYVTLYPRAHDVLRWADWWAMMFAAVLVPEWLPLPRLSRKRAVLVFGLAAAAVPVVASIHPRGPASLMMRPWSASIMHAARVALDFDHDGYAALLGGGDCDEFDPHVNPGAREIPGNGIDDNCMLGDAKPVKKSTARPLAATEPAPFDVVFVTIDSLRPDHMGLYNPKYGPSGRNTCPNLDAFAQRSVVFDHAYAPGAWTSIAIASIMRGLYPRRLSWTSYYETNSMRLLRKRALQHLPRYEQAHQMFPLAFTDPHPTLAALFHAHGMRTAAVVHDGFSRMLTHGVGVERDFDNYWEVETWESNHADDSGTTSLAIRELSRAPKDRHLFLWVHFFGPHSPNQTHPDVPQYGPTLIDGYDHEIRYMDAQLPPLWQAIERRGKPTIIVVTGDHGEVFGDTVRMHGFSISEQDIRVPLLVSVPGWSPRRVTQLVSTLDIFPTLLALTHTPAPPGGDGVDLSAWARGVAKTVPRMLISETWRFERDGSPIVDLIAAFDGFQKIVLDTVDHSLRAYDQRAPVERPSWVDARQPSPLARFLLQYAEDTGGPLAPGE